MEIATAPASRNFSNEAFGTLRSYKYFKKNQNFVDLMRKILLK